MPPAVYVLGLAIFAQGTSELMLAGLLPEMSADLGVSIPAAGMLISAFALGMLVGAPVLAVATLRWSRRTALLAFMAVFALTHVAGALAPDYGLLLATRVVSAFVYAGFWALAATTATSLVPADRRARAIGVVTSGLTVASIIGLPLGTVIGQQLGWQSAFWAVAAMSLLALAGVAATIPGGRPAAAQAPSIRAELRVLADPWVWLAYGTTILSISALMGTFSYLSPLLTEVTGLAAAWVPAVLALYGLGAFIGISVSGRIADRRPFGTLYTGVIGLIAASVALGLAAGSPLLAVPLVLLLGGFGFGLNPALNVRVFTLAGQAPTLANAVHVSAFNAGITLGPLLGGLAIDAGAGFTSPTWIGAGLGVLALGAVALAARGAPRTAAVPAVPAAERPAPVPQAEPPA
ncbi:Cmx/CmrA family chloramphenicol efflux MFS transporter [Allonocardiopsis opalescens]|uniref:DHA1 family chloramphenicol resistance protein-like MFS transporter n=1 Tax=Allonocardiopsis opalescens TaxID=1144618 RepID=A0A2T0PXU0_9ACTN|nr:Cmx/CmrA family chloramphenicol efflux MFS transporter [Allonocardiopsis opalescens]PRX96354.1 DHA1 family chloramphenicol resistance protein-like MFS transporter [Allonocardiopsis opalescens]